MWTPASEIEAQEVVSSCWLWLAWAGIALLIPAPARVCGRDGVIT